VLAVLLAAIAAVALAILLQSAPRRSGTNMTSDLGYAIAIQPGQVLCEPGEIVPADTAALALTARAGGGAGPTLAVDISDAARTVASGSLAAGWRTGAVRIPLRRALARTVAGASVCLRDVGARPVAFGGSLPDGSFTVLIDGRGLGGRLRIDYMRPGKQTWLALAPELARRLARVKPSFARPWSAVAALVLLLVSVALAVRTVLLEERRG
jgi:hypothetical protein